MGPTFYKLLEESSLKYGDREFVFDGTRRMTFRQLHATGEFLARRLHAEGLRPGDIVLVCIPNWAEYLQVYAAVSACGAVFATCSAGLKRGGLLDVVRLVEPRVVFVAAVEHVDVLREAEYEGLIVGVRLDDVRCLPFEGFAGGGLAACGGEAPASSLPPCDSFEPEAEIDVSTIIFTSGSTGAPKGVMSTACAHEYVSRQIASSIEVTQDDVFYVPVSFCHIFGLCNGILIPLEYGCRLVVSDAYSPTRAIDLIEEEGCTVQLGVPTMFIWQLRVSIERKKPFALRAAIAGGAKIPAGLAREYEDVVGCRLLSSYGMSETTGGVTATYWEDNERHRHETDGLPIDGSTLAVFDEDGEVGAAGVVGEIAVKTPGIMAGYYFGGPVARDPSLRDSWFKTGDLGWLDDEGYLHTTGRIKDVVLRGGINIYPDEVECIFRHLPCVDDVCLLGYDGGDLGERACLVISPVSGNPPCTEEGLKKYAVEHLEKEKVPDKVLLLPELPRLHSGKVDKIALRKTVEALLG